jgi:hypothetical protein
MALSWSDAEVMYDDNSFVAWYIVNFKDWKKSCLYTEVAATVIGVCLAVGQVLSTSSFLHGGSY